MQVLAKYIQRVIYTSVHSTSLNAIQQIERAIFYYAPMIKPARRRSKALTGR